MPATQTAPVAAIDNRKVEAAAKRALKKSMRQFAADHNARIVADRAAALAATAAHEARWGVDGYECA